MTTKQPEPIITTASIAGAVHGIIVALGLLGLTSWQTKLNAEAETIVSVIGFLLTIGAHYIPALVARTQVTPLASPKAVDGTPLVKADEAASKVSLRIDPPVSLVPRGSVGPAPVVDDDDDPDDPSPDSVEDDADPEPHDEAAPVPYIADHAGKDDGDPTPAAALPVQA